MGKQVAEHRQASDGQRIGLIAGNGRFPIIFADNAKRLGYYVSAVAHEGETDPELARHVDHIHWIKIGQFGKLIEALKGDGAQSCWAVSRRRTYFPRSGRTFAPWPWPLN